MATRRLSAIMFTDIVGYSAMTQKDEARTLRLLGEHNTLLRSLIPRHHGTEIKTIGDAFLVEFSSALDAVRCAVEIQAALRDRNTHAPAEEHIDIRIGIHLGDVIHEDGDVLGDGVNIASRIYPLAEPGGICITSAIGEQVRNKIDYPLRDLPKHELKNISSDISVCDVVLPWSGRRRTQLLSPRAIRIIRTATLTAAAVLLALWYFGDLDSMQDHPRSRIAVLPFKNISPTDEHDFFADGMTEELISTLSRISGLEIIARSSVYTYQEASLDFNIIGDRLKAGTIVEGSIRHVGDSVRVTVRLIDASNERLLWDEVYDRPIANALKIQDDIALNVAGALRVQILDAERIDLMNEREHHPDAWRLYLLGRYHVNKRTSEDVLKSLSYFQRSIESDSSFAPAFAGLGESYVLIAGAGYGNIPRERALNGAIEATDKAIELDPRMAEAYAVRGYTLYRLLWSWNDADSLFRRALEIKPSFARGHEWYGLYLSLNGRTAEGLTEMRKAASLDPHSPSVATGVGRLLAFDDQYQASVDHLTKVIQEYPTYPEAYFALALSYAYMEQYDASFRNFEKALEYSGRRLVILGDYGFFLAKTGNTERARAILAELDSIAQQRPIMKWFRGLIRVELGETDAGFDLLEASAADQEGLLVYLRADDAFSSLRDHPRFRAIERKVWKER